MRCEQQAGEFVISFPAAHTTAISHGYNIGESISLCLAPAAFSSPEQQESPLPPAKPLLLSSDDLALPPPPAAPLPACSDEAAPTPRQPPDSLGALAPPSKRRRPSPSAVSDDLMMEDASGLGDAPPPHTAGPPRPAAQPGSPGPSPSRTASTVQQVEEPPPQPQAALSSAPSPLRLASSPQPKKQASPLGSQLQPHHRGLAKQQQQQLPGGVKRQLPDSSFMGDGDEEADPYDYETMVSKEEVALPQRPASDPLGDRGASVQREGDGGSSGGIAAEEEPAAKRRGNVTEAARSPAAGGMPSSPQGLHEGLPAPELKSSPAARSVAPVHEATPPHRSPVPEPRVLPAARPLASVPMVSSPRRPPGCLLPGGAALLHVETRVGSPPSTESAPVSATAQEAATTTSLASGRTAEPVLLIPAEPAAHDASEGAVAATGIGAAPTVGGPRGNHRLKRRALAASVPPEGAAIPSAAAALALPEGEATLAAAADAATTAAASASPGEPAGALATSADPIDDATPATAATPAAMVVPVPVVVACEDGGVAVVPDEDPLPHNPTVIRGSLGSPALDRSLHEPCPAAAAGPEPGASPAFLPAIEGSLCPAGPKAAMGPPALPDLLPADSCFEESLR